MPFLPDPAFFHRQVFSPVVSFQPEKDKLIPFDFTDNNPDLTADLLENTPAYCQYLDDKRQKAGALYGIGGYGENRTVYSRSRVFDDPAGGEPRRLHLGVDIWGSVGTPVFAPLPGKVHSFQFNNHFGDYGATIILQHAFENQVFYTLYGHLSLKDLQLQEGQIIVAGQEFAHFGLPEENGHWPPHLHFQIIMDMQDFWGDYPGVCRFSEKEKYLSLCPDPDLILQMQQYLKG